MGKGKELDPSWLDTKRRVRAALNVAMHGLDGHKDIDAVTAGYFFGIHQHQYAYTIWTVDHEQLILFGRLTPDDPTHMITEVHVPFIDLEIAPWYTRHEFYRAFQRTVQLPKGITLDPYNYPERGSLSVFSSSLDAVGDLSTVPEHVIAMIGKLPDIRMAVQGWKL